MAALASVALPSTVYSVPAGFAPPAAYGVAETARAWASARNWALLSRILVGRSVLDEERGTAGLTAVTGFTRTPSFPLELNVFGARRRRTIGEDLFVGGNTAIAGLEFTLFDPRRLYPDDSRVSFVFARSAACPALDGQLVLVEDGAACVEYVGTPVAGADWYLTRPHIHQRYFAERWMDLLMAWVKRFHVPELGWWRHDTLTGWEEFVALAAGRDDATTRQAALESLVVLFRQEVERWSRMAGTVVDPEGASALRAGMASYLAAGER
jgi:hypothetical protein